MSGIPETLAVYDPETGQITTTFSTGLIASANPGPKPIFNRMKALEKSLAGKPYIVNPPMGVDGYVVDGQFVAKPPCPAPGQTWDWSTKQWEDRRTIAEVRADQMAKIDEGFSRAAAKLTEGYPELERLTWPMQQAEALAWAADPDAKTPTLDGIADERGMKREKLRAKALENVRHFMTASQKLVGRRQALNDLIKGAETRREIRDVTWRTPIE